MKGRFAPTPSGRMHLGNALCALLSWLSARAAGMGYVLRIEDLDTLRSGGAFTPLLLDDLRWLGLDWDEGPDVGGDAAPYEQGKREEIYRVWYERLCEAVRVYPCFCSRAQLHAAQAPHQSDGAYVYSGHCRAYTPAQADALLRSGRRAARRVLVPPGTEIRFTDGHCGPQIVRLDREFGDFLVRRSDGVFSYQFAVTVDDALMGVTEVVRARDLLASSACQTFLYQALGFPVPSFTHLPLLLSHDGARLSKRDGAMDLGALRERMRPEDAVGRLAYACGLLERPEPASPRELIPLFRWDKIPKEDIRLPEGLFSA